MINYHIHNQYSVDAEESATIPNYCKRALEIDIKELAFTNHFILIKIGNMDEKLRQIEQQFKDVENAKENFDIKIKIGIEVDYFEGREKEIEKIIGEYPFDFILGSVHFIDDNIVISNPLLYENNSQIEVCKKYFSKLKLAIESRLFDIMAHPDFIRRYFPVFLKNKIQFDEYRDYAKEVIEAIVDNNIGIEMNTSGFRHSLNDSYPSLDFLKLCKETGIKKVTLGSDAHSLVHLGFGLEKGVSILKEAGYEKICLFEKRKPKLFDINKI